MLRQSKETEQYEAVILTGYGEFSYAQEAISLQVAEYLLKPFNRKELEAVLIKLTERVRKKREQSNPMIPESIQVLMEIPAGCSAYVQSAAEWIGVHYANGLPMKYWRKHWGCLRIISTACSVGKPAGRCTAI